MRPFLAVLFYPGCIEYEILLALELLGEQMNVRLFTPDGRSHHGHNGLRCLADGSFADLAGDPLTAVLIPGGDPGGVFGLPDLQRGLRHQAGQGALIAAICAGPLIPAAAGLLAGKRFTHGFGQPPPAPVAAYFTGGRYEDAPVVVDGRLITAQPQAHIDFALAVASALGLIAPERVAALADWYKGRTGSASGLP